MKFSTVLDFAISITRSARRSFGFIVFKALESLMATWCLKLSELPLGEAIVAASVMLTDRTGRSSRLR